MEKLETVLSLVFGLYFIVTYKSSGERGVRSWDYTFRRKVRTIDKQQVAISRAVVFFIGLVMFLHGLTMSYKLFLVNTSH